MRDGKEWLPPALIKRVKRGIIAELENTGAKVCAMELDDGNVWVVVRHWDGNYYEMIYTKDEIHGWGDKLKRICWQIVNNWRLGSWIRWKRGKLYILRKAE